MARKSKSISVYEQIENVQLEITSTEQNLAQLKSQLENLLIEKDELEMRQTWTAIKESGLSMEDVQKILEKIK
jgi:regulator of replication initiation timing